MDVYAQTKEMAMPWESFEFALVQHVAPLGLKQCL